MQKKFEIEQGNPEIWRFKGLEMALCQAGAKWRNIYPWVARICHCRLCCLTGPMRNGLPLSSSNQVASVYIATFWHRLSANIATVLIGCSSTGNDARTLFKRHIFKETFRKDSAIVKPLFDIGPVHAITTHMLF